MLTRLFSCAFLSCIESIHVLARQCCASLSGSLVHLLTRLSVFVLLCPFRRLTKKIIYTNVAPFPGVDRHLILPCKLLQEPFVLALGVLLVVVLLPDFSVSLPVVVNKFCLPFSLRHFLTYLYVWRFGCKYICEVPLQFSLFCDPLVSLVI